MSTTTNRKLVLVGGGHTHVQVLKSFAADPPPKCEITIIAAEAVAMYSGMAPGFVAGQYERRELEIDVRPLATLCGARAIIAACTSVDPVNRKVHVDGQGSIPFDVASFNLGSTVLGLDTPGVGDHTLATRPLSNLVAGVDELVTRAKIHDDETPFHVIVVGGGVGGVELALTMQSRLSSESGRQVAATLIDGGEHILARQSNSLRRRVLRKLADRGIAVRNLTRVQAVHVDGVKLDDGDRLASDAVIWVTGPASHGVFRNSPEVSTDDGGYALIRSTLQFVRHDHCFAVGDCATLIDHPDTPRAGVYAVREGPVLSRNLRSFLAGAPLETYTPQSDFLMLLNSGDGTAIGGKWGMTFAGRWVMWLKDHIDRKFVNEFQVSGRSIAGRKSRRSAMS